MKTSAMTVSVAFLALCAAGCSDRQTQTEPRMSASGTPLAATSAAGGGTRLVTMLDACDPTSFNAVLGAGTCVRNGGVTFEQFISELTARGTAGGWLFAPSNMNVKVGTTLLAVNRGGEAHTFTEVEHFGGGFVTSLNQLSGNPVPATECLQLAPSDFVPPGGTHSESVEDEGTENYQCCIHPWMRTTVTAKKG